MLGCDESLADDLTQETLLKVLGRDSFTQLSDTATAAYLRRTAHNLLVSFHRKGGRANAKGRRRILKLRQPPPTHDEIFS